MGRHHASSISPYPNNPYTAQDGEFRYRPSNPFMVRQSNVILILSRDTNYIYEKSSAIQLLQYESLQRIG